MRLAFIVRDDQPHQVATAEALAHGLRTHGDAFERYTSARLAKVSAAFDRCDAVAVWGWRTGEALRDEGHRVLVMERAYLADRYEWVSLGWNGLNARAAWPIATDGGDRWRRYFAPLAKPWRKPGTGKYALLMGQVAHDTACRGIHFTRWANSIAIAARTAFPVPVRFRPHPLYVTNDYPNAPAYPGLPLEVELAGAEVVITYNSTSGVDAVMAGVPTVAIDEGSMVWPVASHAIRAPLRRPDRDEWGSQLAYRQWLPRELRDGSAWGAVRAVVAEGRA